MSRWTAESGTLYGDLFDRSVLAFGIPVTSGDGMSCYGDPAGNACRCCFESERFHVSLCTPQYVPIVDCQTFLRRICGAPIQIEASLWKYPLTSRSVLTVTRLAESHDMDWEWLDAGRTESAFVLGQSPEDVAAARHALTKASQDGGWMRATLRHDGGIYLDPCSRDNPSAIRMVQMFSGPKFDVYALQARTPSSFRRIHLDIGSFVIAGVDMNKQASPDHRIEVMAIVFRPDGTSSWNFMWPIPSRRFD